MLLQLSKLYLIVQNIVWLTGKLKQASKLDENEDWKLNLNIEVDNFSVTLYKDQYDNICRLAEVAGEYEKFQRL